MSLLVLSRFRDVEGWVKRRSQCVAPLWIASYSPSKFISIAIIDATTTSTEASTTIAELDTEQEKATTTPPNVDTTTTDNQQSDAEKTDSPTIIERRSVGQANARVGKLRSVEQSDIYSSSAHLSPNVLLLLLFALCLAVRFL